MKDELALRLKEQIPKSKGKRVELSTYVQELLWHQIENADLVRQFAPLQFINTVDSSIFIKDRIKGSIVEVVVRDDDLFCLKDESKICIHVGFAWATPEVSKVMREHGRKQPRQ